MVAFIGIWEFLILLAVIVFVFGSRRVGKALGSLKIGGREFKRGIRGEKELAPPAERRQRSDAG